MMTFEDLVIPDPQTLIKPVENEGPGDPETPQPLNPYKTWGK